MDGAALLEQSGGVALFCRMRPRKTAARRMYNPLQFIQEVRQEVAKVTWPTWKEVWITTLMVLVMVALASIFFLIADQVLGWFINLVLGLGR